MTSGEIEMPKSILAVGFLACVLALWADPAAAYIGPGAGITMLGALWGVIVVVVLVVATLIWFPVQVMRRRRRARRPDAPSISTRDTEKQ